MQGQIFEEYLGGRACWVYLPPDYEMCQKRYPVLYANDAALIRRVWEKICLEVEEGFRSGGLRRFILVALEPRTRDDEYTPWTADAVSVDGTAFGGAGDAYLDSLVRWVKVETDRKYLTKKSPRDTGIIGYSLGGLIALYALYQTDVFGLCACLSGSLWYPGWAEFAEKQMPRRRDERVYLSLGKTEDKSRNRWMSTVSDCTFRTLDSLRNALGRDKVCFAWNEGGHFHGIPERFLLALGWMFGEQG